MRIAFAVSIIQNYVGKTLASMTIIALLLCTFFIVWGGIKYITSAGNPTKLERAKHILIRALIGLIIVFGASAISLILMHAYSLHSTTLSSQLPALKPIKTANSSGSLVDVLLKAISGLLMVVVKSVASPFIQALNYFTKATPLLTANSSVMHLWVISTVMADGLFVLVIAMIGFHVMSAGQLGLRDVNLSNLIPQLLFAFVLMNSSVYIIDAIIGLSNVMISALRAGVGNVNPWNSLMAVISNVSGYSIAALFILVVLMIFTVILLIYYIGRIVVIYLGGVLSPLIILLWLMPGFRDFAENVFKTYLSTIFVLFIHVIILSLAGSLFAQLAQGNSSGSDPIMALLLGLATLIALIKTQGVLMQLNYASLGPKTARRLGGSFMNGVSSMAVVTKSSVSEVMSPMASVVSLGINRILPESKPLVIKEQSNLAAGKVLRNKKQ